MRLGGGLPRNGGAPIPCGGGVPCGGGSAPRNGGGVPANGGGPPWLHRSPGAREGNTFSSIDPPPRAEWGSHLDPAARLLSNTALPLPADRRGAPARWDGFVFDFPPHFRHCAPPLSSPAGTNVHPTPLHSVHSGHISTLFAQVNLPISMKPTIKRRLLWAFTFPIVAVAALWAYGSVPITASWAEFGYYGKFNQVQRIIRAIPGLTIVDHTQHHDVIMEDFSFTVANPDGAIIRIDFWENRPEMRLTKDDDIRLYIERVIADRIRVISSSDASFHRLSSPCPTHHERTRTPQPTSHGRVVLPEIFSVSTAITGGWV